MVGLKKKKWENSSRVLKTKAENQIQCMVDWILVFKIGKTFLGHLRKYKYGWYQYGFKELLLTFCCANGLFV